LTDGAFDAKFNLAYNIVKSQLSHIGNVLLTERAANVTLFGPAQALRAWRADATLPEFEPGWVWLTGAGPGDPGLLTLAAVNALSQADVVVYDALVDERVLRFARLGAEFVFAGKRGGEASPKQSEITAQLIGLARRNLRVLRLKGGDPFVFGRGAEEATALTEAGTPVKVIPGVSAGIGGLAAAGIPLTHRDVNQAVTFVTGHDVHGHLPAKIDWFALAKSSPVIVVYMGLKHRRKIARALLAAGREPREPAAIVSEAATPRQSVLELTLSEMAGELPVEPRGPAMLVFGEVVALRHEMGQVNPHRGTSTGSQMGR
jgi:uroporphyrin-III C-methyltransferase